MGTTVSIVIAFLLVSAGVTALARNTTARWERDRRREERARRRAATVLAAPPGGPATRFGRAWATARPAVRLRVLRRAAGSGLATARQRGERAAPQLTAVLRRWHAAHPDHADHPDHPDHPEHRHPAQPVARVVRRRTRRHRSRPADERSDSGA